MADDSTARPFRLPSSGAKKRTLAHIFELRIGIEVQAAILAAERRRQSDLKAMTKHLRAMAPGHGSFEAALAADIGFHLAIAEATHNPLIVGFTQFLQPHLQSFISQSRANVGEKSGDRAHGLQGASLDLRCDQRGRSAQGRNGRPQGAGADSAKAVRVTMP